MSIFPSRRRRPQPRSTGELLSQFTDLDGIPTTPPTTEPDQPIEQAGRRSGGRQRVNQATTPVQGPREPGREWAAVDASRRAPVHRATSA